MRKLYGFGFVQNDCLESVGFCYCFLFESVLGRRKSFFGRDRDFGISFFEGVFLSLEIVFLFLYELYVFFKRLVQINEKEVCSLMFYVFGGVLFLYGYG